MKINTSNIRYKSYCWSLGTTSFRTRNFNRRIEEQLALLQEFWSENPNQQWQSNNALQIRYYDFLAEHGFVKGDAKLKDKDAREKTSGLVDLGLIGENRKLTAVGDSLLQISKLHDFTVDNFLDISKDSFIYLKQLLKMSVENEGAVVRPLIVLLYILSKVEYLTIKEFTYLLPLCIDKPSTDYIIEQISLLREQETSVDDIILRVILQMNNYNAALQYFMKHKVTEQVICKIGMNRKSRTYDKPYFEMYKQLWLVFVKGKIENTKALFDAVKEVNISKWWISYLFKNTNKKTLIQNPINCIKPNHLQTIKTEEEFKLLFFHLMHLFKVKATLSDYEDLNKRYLKAANILLFADEKVQLDIIPKCYFNRISSDLYKEAFTTTPYLEVDCSLEKISSALVYDEKLLLQDINSTIGKPIPTILEARNIVKEERYQRFHKLITDKFSNEQILKILKHIEEREDNEVNQLVTDNASVPTIFEYILAIAWYKISEYHGRILDYMKLSLDADLLPVTHASGGEADIVYEYAPTENYPAHDLLIEATLTNSTNQRVAEMEPVSRHLGNHLFVNPNSYCIFIANYLHMQLISDFRSRKHYPYYHPDDYDQKLDTMNIISLSIKDICFIIEHNIRYPELYKKFQIAYHCNEPDPKTWHETYVRFTT